MAVKGLGIFRDYFADYKDSFLLIGGTIVKLFVPEPRHAKISFGD